MRVATSIARIYADEYGFKHKELTERLIGIFFNIDNELGHGFLESVYEQAFSVVLAENKILRYVFENVRKNPQSPRESAEKQLPGRCG